MTYNRFQYNTALYNAGRDEAAAIAKSIIQAHTGPHVQAVIGASGGTTLISDFIITEGTVKKPPTQYKFPDLSAAIRAYQVRPSSEGTFDGLAINDLVTFLRAQAFADMPACIFITNKTPNLPARIFGLFEANLLATITGELGQHDLPGIIQALVLDLAAEMLGIAAPSLPATMTGHLPANLGARIHAPLDLGAFLGPVQRSDLAAILDAISVANLPASMLGVLAPNLSAYLRSMAAGVKDLPARATPLSFTPGILASITPVFTGDTGFGVGLPTTITGATLSGAEGSVDFMGGFIRATFSGVGGDLGAQIQNADSLSDLIATVTGGGGSNLGGSIGLIPVGEKDRTLSAFAQAVTSTSLGASLFPNNNIAFMPASLFARSDKGDLSARIRVSETFITAILTISTLASRDLKVTIGNPGCAGGSAAVSLGAAATAQHARDLSASLQSFITHDLGASVNSENIFFAYDTINVAFSPFKVIKETIFSATDTIPVLFSPFRGQNLSAVISSIPNNIDLGASLTAVFPLPRVVPAVNRLTAADLRLTEPQNIQEIRLQLEGSLLEYIYVNGTDNSFIKDFNETWKINVRSFKPIAEGLFGDRAAAKICTLGGLLNFATLDEAVRFCISSVLGFESQSNMGAAITATGGSSVLSATMSIQNLFTNLGGSTSSVFSSDFAATITASP